MIATICSSVKRTLRIAPSESGASLSTYRWAENPGAGHWSRTAIEQRFLAQWRFRTSCHDTLKCTKNGEAHTSCIAPTL
jgi:hypothetical protein